MALCRDMQEITAIFGSVNAISHTYRDKDGYIMKRLYQLSEDERGFCEEGFSDSGHSNALQIKPTFEGKPWQMGEFPTDAELVASVFCALLDYSIKWKRRHLYDASLPISEIAKFDRKDISLVNRQPSSIFRAHFEVYVHQKLYRNPAVSLMLLLEQKVTNSSFSVLFRDL